MKILTIIGARPQFIKVATVSRAILKYNKTQCENSIKEVIIHTGQHFDKNMSEVFFKEMQIPKPDYNLNINCLSHGAMTGKMIEAIEKVLITERPDILLVYGDTNSTLAGSLAASKLHIPIAHVEAGLRSFNRKMPEEINRVLTDHISSILFCPTHLAVNNLKQEGIINNNSRKIVLSGDVMLDAAIFYKSHKKKPNVVLPSKFILATIHREENTDTSEKLKKIIENFKLIGKDIVIVLPLHPRTKNLIKRYNIDIVTDKIVIIDPVSYLEMVYLLTYCQLVMTDSGGVQKEAFFFCKPCITIRDETEWVELVENGVNMLSTLKQDDMINSFNKMRNVKISNRLNLYGDGNAAKKIVTSLIEIL